MCKLLSYSSSQLIVLRFFLSVQTYFFISQLCASFYFDNALPMETSFCITFGSISFGGQGLGGVFFFFVFITRKKVKIICIKRRKIDFFVKKMYYLLMASKFLSCVNRFKKKKKEVKIILKIFLKGLCHEINLFWRHIVTNRLFLSLRG